MSDKAEINYVSKSKIDFSKGFQHFHVKWPLKDLTRRKASSIFETTVTDGDRSITFTWSLGVRDSSKYPTKTWLGADLITSGKATPMVYRVCLSSSTKILFDSSYFVVIDGTLGCGELIPSSEVDEYPINDLVLQFWIDIPAEVAIDNNSDKLEKSNGNNSFQKASNDVFFSDHAKIFSRVVGPDSDRLSDFSVIIVNDKDEELRRFNCHTIFLSSRSDVFERMFALEEWEENSKDGRSVRIKDICAEVMETVLEYIYTSTLPDPSIHHDDLCGIIFAADKYNLKELKHWCASVLIHNHSLIKCRIEQLILADRHNLAQLKAVCIDQLSFGFSSFQDQATVNLIPGYLWSEIMKDMSDRHVKTTHITLSAA